MQIHPLLFFLLLGSGCESSEVILDAGTPSSDGQAMPASSPRRITLARTFGGPGAGLRLADGTLVSEGGDVQLFETMVVSLRTPSPESMCPKGTFASLDAVPTGAAECPHGGGWNIAWTLGGSTLGIDQWIGAAALVRDASHSTTYRLRVVGDSLDGSGVKLTFDYAPIPEPFPR